MHHFATKEALLHGVIMHFTDQVEREVTRLVAEDPHRNFRWVRAMLNLMTQESSSVSQDMSSNDTLERFMLSVLAATVHNPELAKPVQAIGQRLRGRLTSVPDEGLEQLVLWLVIDGLFLWQFVGMLDAQDPLIHQIYDYIRSRIDNFGVSTSHAVSQNAVSSSSAKDPRTTNEVDLPSVKKRHTRRGDK